jgi:hypothetical protein
LENFSFPSKKQSIKKVKFLKINYISLFIYIYYLPYEWMLAGSSAQLTCLCVCVWEPNGIKIELLQKLSLKVAIHLLYTASHSQLFFVLDHQSVFVTLSLPRICCRDLWVEECELFELVHVYNSLLNSQIPAREMQRVKSFLKHNMVEECGVCM